MRHVEIINADALTGLKKLEDESIDCVVTSPPYYGLRVYGVPRMWDDGYEGELGFEPGIWQYIEHLMQIFKQVKRVLKKDGTCWVVMGDTYNGDKIGYTYGQYADGRKLKQQYQKGDIYKHRYHKKPLADVPVKSLLMIPARFAITMTYDGWILRNEIIWVKNGMASSAKDRYTINYDHIYFFSKSPKYNFQTQYQPYSPATLGQFGQKYNGRGQKDYALNNVQNPSDVKRSIIKSINTNLKMPPIGGKKKAGGNNPTYSGNTPYFSEKGAIMRAVWKINNQPSPIKHYATFPEKLVQRMLAPIKGQNAVILDPFAGVGTVGVVAHKMNFASIMIEPSAEYCGYIQQRLDKMVTYLLKNI